MSAKKITEQTAKWGTTGLLTAGVIISTGLLSFCGMLFIHPSLVLAWVAFGLAGFVDGEVYKQNIAKGIDNLKLLGNRGIDVFIIKAWDERIKLLEKKFKKSPNLELNWFEKAYLDQKKYVASFEHKKLNTEQKRDKKNAIKRLRRMQKFFVKCVLSSNDEGLEELTDPVRKELPTFKRKLWYLRASIPICLSAGAGFGFATASSLSIALIGIGMTAALSATIWPLAAVACIGYAFVIYQTVADIICHDTFHKWKAKFLTWFERKKSAPGEKVESNIKYGLRVVGTALLLSLTIGVGIIATLATAGTWWMAVKNGALLLPVFAAAANHIRNVLVPLASVTNLIFTFKNSLISVKNILAIKPMQALREKKAEIKTFFKNESLPQLLNPFRIITKLISLPFMFIVFIGHIIAVGLIGDRTPGLNYGATIASAVSGAASDGLVDLHYVSGHDHETDESKKNASSNAKDHTHTSEKETDPHSEHAHQHSHDCAHADDDHEHEHNHGLIADWFLKIALSPLLLLSALYSFAVTPPKESNWKENLKNELRKSFGIKNQEVYVEKTPAPNRDAAWINKEISLRFEKHRNKEKDTGTKESLDSLESTIKTNINDPTYTLCTTGMFSKNHLQKFADSVSKDYFPNARRLGT
jgi:hypothetical protein